VTEEELRAESARRTKEAEAATAAKQAAEAAKRSAEAAKIKEPEPVAPVKAPEVPAAKPPAPAPAPAVEAPKPVEAVPAPKEPTKYGVPESQWNEMARFNDYEQMAKWGTTRAKLIEQATLGEPKQSAPPAGVERVLTYDGGKKSKSKVDVSVIKGPEGWYGGSHLNFEGNYAGFGRHPIVGIGPKFDTREKAISWELQDIIRYAQGEKRMT
jgi:hypothetical protein